MAGHPPNKPRSRTKAASERAAEMKEPSFLETVKKAPGQIVQQVGDVVETVKDKAPDLGVDKLVEQAKNVVTGIEIPQPLVDAAKSTTGTIMDTVDQLTGSKLLELVREAQEKQARYNDVLATRLAEALERIDRIEKHLGLRDYSGGVR